MQVEYKIKKILKKLTRLKQITLEIPKAEFGDYAFACFSLAHEQKKNPDAVAKELVTKLKQSLKEIPEISKVEAVGGYLNFTVDKSNFLRVVIEKILADKEKYGSLQLKGKALIEHTSINPNASPHLGRIRNAIIGDILARLLRFHGYKTEVHYYVNDVSKQMALLVLGSKGTETFDDLLKLYIKMSRKVEEEPELEQKIFEILKKVEEQDKETMVKLNKLVKTAVEGQRKILARLKIFYDSFDYESMYLKKNRLKDILKQLEKTKRLEKDIERRYILNQGNMKWQFEREMKSPVLVLTRSDGTGLYVLRDIAYTIDKMKTAATNIIVLGEDQKLYFKQLSAALELLGYGAPRVVHYSFVLLKTEKGAKKMATRKGEVVLVSDFIEEALKKAEEEIKKRKRESKVDLKKVAEAIAIGAVRYSIAKVEQDKGILFDWNEALNFEGNSGPYLQYVYARASSILKKLQKKKGKLTKESYEKVDDKEYALVKELALFPEIARVSLEQLRTHLLCNYVYRLAQTFNDFYESCPVINAESGVKERRILLVRATKQVLENALNLIGVPAIKAM